MSRASVTLWLDPLNERLGRDRIFDRADPANNDAALEPYAHLRDRLGASGVDVHTADLLAEGHLTPATVNLYATMGSVRRCRMLARRDDVVMSAFFVNEAPVVEPRVFAELPKVAEAFRRLYSYAPDDALEPFLTRRLSFRPRRFPYAFSSVHDETWSNADRSFLTMVATNKAPRLATGELYSARIRAVEYFARQGEIDLFGIGWDGPAFRVGETRVPQPLRNVGHRIEKWWARRRPSGNGRLDAVRSAYRGPVPSTVATLGRYTFSICFENMTLEGWVTEKIFNSLRAGAIPVYHGAPDIDRWVWPECFIDMRRFGGFAELRDYLRGLSDAEVATYREAGRAYFSSDEFQPFTKDAFAETFLEIVRDDAEAGR